MLFEEEKQSFMMNGNLVPKNESQKLENQQQQQKKKTQNKKTKWKSIKLKFQNCSRSPFVFLFE